MIWPYITARQDTGGVIDESPRAVLVVPGSDQRETAKALSLDVDEVVLDLEDAVIPANKSTARAVVLDTIAIPKVQSATTTSEFTPTADAVEQAHRILDALEAVAVSARRTLLQAKEQ